MLRLYVHCLSCIKILSSIERRSLHSGDYEAAVWNERHRVRYMCTDVAEEHDASTIWANDRPCAKIQYRYRDRVDTPSLAGLKLCPHLQLKA
jgi:hypothetical protein